MQCLTCNSLLPFPCLPTFFSSLSLSLDDFWPCRVCSSYVFWGREHSLPTRVVFRPATKVNPGWERIWSLSSFFSFFPYGFFLVKLTIQTRPWLDREISPNHGKTRNLQNIRLSCIYNISKNKSNTIVTNLRRSISKIMASFVAITLYGVHSICLK